MKKLPFLFLIILLSGCMVYKKGPKKTESGYKILVNEGTVCLLAKNSQLKGVYYPLNTNCLPSNLYSWKMDSIDFENTPNGVKMQTYGLYKRIDSKAALADCGGAGIKSSKISVNTPVTIYWDKTKLVTLKDGQSACFKKAGESIIKVKGKAGAF